jgi:periplasmic divalent cation tolerance protein
MDENNKPVLVYATFPTHELAADLATHLVEAGLAACVNLIPGMTAIYRWEGQLHQDAEVVMLVKTRRPLANRVMDQIRARHTYDNPALLVLAVEDGAAPYLDWIVAQTQR